MIGKQTRAASRYLSDLFRDGAASALDDAELLDRFASRQAEHDEGAEMAFAALLTRHGPMVLRVCRAALGDRHEVDDAFQATFLVLAARARSIRRGGSVASWLHGVAMRVAASERSRAARRRRHERIRAAMTPSATAGMASDPLSDGERSLAIHEEIGRLPEKHRAAIVLCYLEGLTHEMAARHLGWPVGSVRSRLAWARDRLRVRLVRRGLAPDSLPFDHAGTPSDDRRGATDPVALGTPLIEATLRGALEAGFGRRTLAGIASAEAIALAAGALRSMIAAGSMLVIVVGLIAWLAVAGAGGPSPGTAAQQDSPRAVVPGPAVAKPAADRGPIDLQAEVVDPDGHSLAGADIAVLVWYSRGSGAGESIFLRTRADAEGHARLEVARQRPGAMVHHASIWAHQPGRALATASILLAGDAPPPPARLTLDRPANRTIMVLGPEDRPMAGLRVAPVSIQNPNRRAVLHIVPDEWIERFTVTTDARGVAVLAGLPRSLVPLSIRVAGPGFAPQALPLDAPHAEEIVLKLGRPGRVVGIVRSASGAPMADVPVEVWVQRPGMIPGDPARRRITPDEVLRFDPGPIRTGPQGAFQTPPILLTGASYRVSIRPDGFVPFLSDWVALEGERASISEVRLQPLRKVVGRVHDRQGRTIAGARVFVPGGGPATTTDAEGRFALVGINAAKAVVLVESSGFRLRGWVVDPSVRDDLGSLAVVRIGEGPGPAMKPPADPIPPAEARALADRLLEPYLREEPKAENRARLAAIETLGEFDLDRALDLLQDGKFPEEDPSYQFARSELATLLAGRDPASARAMAEAIPVPERKSRALVSIARALPVSERARKRDLLNRVAFLLRSELKPANARMRINGLTSLAEQWLDLGDRDHARPLLDEAKSIYDSLPPEKAGPQLAFAGRILAQLARLDPEQALAWMRKLPDPRNSANPIITNDVPAEVAVAIATEHPAEAERAFNLWERRGIQFQNHSYAVLIARRLGRVNPPRARRFAAAQRSPAERALAWACVALSLADSKQAGAAEAVDQAIAEIDRLRESGPGPDQVVIVGGILPMYPTNPAVLILPVVERAAPDRLADVFWRAVALHPRLDPDNRGQLRSSYVGSECMLLAHYDREVAAALFQPMDAYLHSLAGQKGSQGEFNVPAIVGKGCIDPRGAVDLLESLTPPREFSRVHPVHGARLRLAAILGLSGEQRWKGLVGGIPGHLPLDD